MLKLPSADSKRVYIVGYSMGGYGTWEFACRYPELVTAIVPVAGAGDPAEAEKLRNVPLWAIHGADDHIVPVDGSDKMIEAIRETGGVPLYSRLKNVGHDALVPVRQNSQPILHWLFRQNSQRRSLAPAASRLPSTSP
ncbi:dienelactone hydrolase family protein [Blastopirellula marina]|uniref:carboxylesterase family protein n=1 Tax=Blastopirellula marina TaxID=124 RepID=UPI003965838D